jgi:hypothetical protein
MTASIALLALGCSSYQDTVVVLERQVVGPVARSKSDNPRDQQLLLRLTKAEMRVLSAVAALNQVTANTYAHDLLSRRLERLGADPLDQRQITLFDEYGARQSATVVTIGDSERTSGTP